MSQETADLARATHEAVNGRDLDALLALVHPEVEFRSLVAEAEGRDYHGHAGVRVDPWQSVVLCSAGCTL